MSRNTVIKAECEVEAGIEPSDRQRAVGGGDIKAEVKQPRPMQAVGELVSPPTRGRPMSSFISMNLRNQPTVSYRTIIELISTTTTARGFTIRAEKDLYHYETGTKVSDEELASMPLMRHKLRYDWNYTIVQSESRWAPR
jgi:hypothetical protein